MAMSVLGNGLDAAERFEDALVVQEAELAMVRRADAPEERILVVQSNLAGTYQYLGQSEQALRLKRDVYSGYLKLKGEESRNTMVTANNYANGLLGLQRFGEAKALLRTTIPVALRVLGESDTLKLTMRKIFAMALYEDPAATRSDLREATTTLEEIERTARRVLGGAHPTTAAIERNLRASRDALYARGLP